MTSLAQQIKRLKDNGIFDAIIEGLPLEQRLVSRGLINPSVAWCPWDGTQRVLFDGGDSWEVRIKPQPREFWLVGHGKGQPYSVWFYPPIGKVDNEVIHVIEAAE